MKYIGFWEYDRKDIYKVFETEEKLMPKYESDPARWRRKYGKFIEGYWLGMEPKGFSIFEFDNPQQMINLDVAFWPHKKFKFVPLFDHDQVIEAYKEKQKEESSQ